VNSHESATHVTIGAVARIPKMSPNFRMSTMTSNPMPPLVVAGQPT
jgi:hypothetical protein